MLQSVLFGVFVFSVILAVNFDSSFAMHMGSHHEDGKTGQHGMAVSHMMGGNVHHHMAHNGICAPGFASLDGMCTLDDRCGSGPYPGRVCVMDGAIKEYLRPHHQKHAGISADGIICVEGKHLMYKSHNAAPACINSDSVEKIKQRGWQAEKPAIACTKEYNPVCGADGMTYGNMCGLNAQHMAMRHLGECTASGIYLNEKNSTQKQIDSWIACKNSSDSAIQERFPATCALGKDRFVQPVIAAGKSQWQSCISLDGANVVDNGQEPDICITPDGVVFRQQ